MLVMLLILCLVLATRCYGVGDTPAIPSLAAWNRLTSAVKELQGRSPAPRGTLPRMGTSIYVQVSDAPVDGFATVRLAAGNPPDDFTAPTGYPEINHVYVGSAAEGDFIQIVPCNGIDTGWSILMGGGRSRLARIAECQFSNGYAKCHWATGTLASPGYDDSSEFYAFIGKNTWFEANDYVLVSPVETTDTVEWMVTGQLNDPLKRYDDPSTDGSVLAAEQDTPGVHSHCTDTVTP